MKWRKVKDGKWEEEGREGHATFWHFGTCYILASCSVKIRLTEKLKQSLHSLAMYTIPLIFIKTECPLLSAIQGLDKFSPHPQIGQVISSRKCKLGVSASCGSLGIRVPNNTDLRADEDFVLP